MRGCLVSGVLLACLSTPASLGAPIGEEQAKRAALEFGRSLVRGDAGLMRPLLPARGKVQLQLVHLGPEKGMFSGSHVQAVLKDFLREGAVRSFDLLRVQCASEQFALVHARASLADRDGRPADVDLHLTFEPEEGRWVLREIRESPP